MLLYHTFLIRDRGKEKEQGKALVMMQKLNKRRVRKLVNGTVIIGDNLGRRF